MNETNDRKIHKKKIDLRAANPYQYSRLEAARFYFVPCTAEETYDEVIFTYDLAGLRPFAEARLMSDAGKYGLLLQLLEAVISTPEYTFPIHPENLLLDRQMRIRIMERDIAAGMSADSETGMADFKALAGYLLQRRYTYEDLREGGESLLKKHHRTRFLSAAGTFKELSAAFQQRQDEADERSRRRLITVKRSGHRLNLAVTGLALAGCIGLGILVFRQERLVIRPQAAALAAERAYMEQDYPAVADALADVPIAGMDRHEKYLLAVVAIKGQSVDSFDTETKDRLLAKLSYDGAEYLLDYWIALGRLEVDEALDTAMRMSDHQLTLYAYLQKIDLIAADHQLSGEEKVSQTEDLKGKIKTLADELGIEYKEK